MCPVRKTRGHEAADQLLRTIRKDDSMMSRRVQSRLFRSRLKSPTPLALAGAIFVSTLYHTPAPAEGPREDPADQFVIGERPFAASSSWNTPIAEGAIYQKVGWPIAARFGVAWSSYSPAIYAASNFDPVVSVRYPRGWGYPGGIVNVHMPPDADGAVGYRWRVVGDRRRHRAQFLAIQAAQSH